MEPTDTVVGRVDEKATASRQRAVGKARRSRRLPARSDADKEDLSFNVSFLLLDNFSLISFSSAIEPLRIANKILKRETFRYSCHSVDGAMVSASNGMRMCVDETMEVIGDVDLFVICSSDDVEKIVLTGAVKAKIRELSRGRSAIAGICTGSHVLAELGLLQDRACTIHWEYAAAFRELFPNIRLSPDLVKVDGRILTCAGGTSAMDMMIGYIENSCGLKIGHTIADIAMHSEVRSGSERQRGMMRLRPGPLYPRLLRCIEIMEENIEVPLSLPEIAGQLGICPRQLQRNFRRHLGESPSSFYQNLRLERARQLVQRTMLPIVEVAVATGFANPSNFSARYRNAFGVTPMRDRSSQDTGGR